MSRRPNYLMTFVQGALLLSASLIFQSNTALAHDPLRDEHHKAHYKPHGGIDDARALVIAFRETGDDRNLDQAWQILEPALKSNDPPADLLVTAAFVAQSRHEFTRAQKLLERALAMNSNDDEARLLSASIYLVRGDANAAAKACGELRQVEALVRITCNARVAVATREHSRALRSLEGVLKIVDTEHIPSELLAWSYSVAGDLAVASSEATKAIDLYRQSLGLAERTQVRAALIDVYISEADYASAWQALDAEKTALPLLVRRLILAKKLDRIDSVRPQLHRVQHEFEDWIRDEDWLHAREMTRFYIDVVERPELARKLALINIRLQQEPEDLLLEVRTRS